MNYYSIQNSRDSSINSIEIRICSSKSIVKKSSRILPNGNIVGEIKTAQTMNYKTLKPENSGLFCEQTFGPIKDFECACGKKYENEFIGFCAICGIEYASSQVRRNRLGYIKLVSPVVHIWYLKYISILLDIPLKSIESIVYSTDEIIFKNYFKKPKQNQITKKEIFEVTENLNNTHVKNSINLKYSLHIQKNILSYLKNLKQAVFILKTRQDQQLKYNFSYLYYTLNNFYSLSYSFQWEAKKQWNTIIWFFKYKQRMKENFIKIDPLQKKLNDEYFEKTFLFGTSILYCWLKYFDYNFQLLNLERQIRFTVFEIKEEIKELSGILFSYFFQKQQFISFQKRIKKLNWKKNKVFRRLKLIMYFRQAKLQPKWMILSSLPILPPDLRPIVELGSNKVAVSDLNKSYQTIILRNLRLKKFYNTSAFNEFTEEIRYTKRLLQESVDELIQQDKSKKNTNISSKSLSDILKGKRGRFRQNLLGKRVDYSGRSVIIVDPELKLHECGIPLKMAIELFYPFIIQYLISFNITKTIPGAKHIIQTRASILNEIIHFVLNNYLVLLNRAPTLHKLGIQAFKPKLVTGKAIKLHPLVCPAFNADFDGDQMGMHIPLSFESRAESWKLLWSRNNLLLSSMGSPILTPGQDVVLGCYYLTSNLLNKVKTYIKPCHLNKKHESWSIYFNNLNDVLKAYNQNKVNIHTEIWIKWSENIMFEDNSLDLKKLEVYSGKFLRFQYQNYQINYNLKGYQLSQYIKTTVGRVIFNSLLY